jgi:hypothetical protein
LHAGQGGHILYDVRAFLLDVGCASFLILAAIVTARAADGKKPGEKPSREALKELSTAIRLLDSNQIERGVEALQNLIALHPKDPAAEKARTLLLDYGVGKEIRVVLDDRKVFRGGFKILDKDVLSMAESALAEVRPFYEDCSPFFTRSRLVAVLYDSEARFRKAGGSVTSSGHFRMEGRDFKTRTLEGKIEWHLPKYAATLKDRQLSMKGSFYHETAHYMNAISFGGALPSVLEEGIAEYLESRLNKDFYQYYRETDRERTESNARNSLNSITKFEGFLAFLSGGRGFGEGGVMVSRWYGLCYATVDFFEEGKISETKSSFGALLASIGKIATEGAARVKAGRPPPRMDAKVTLERIAKDIYGCDLAAFHQALVQHILARYRQK